MRVGVKTKSYSSSGLLPPQFSSALGHQDTGLLVRFVNFLFLNFKIALKS